jgi:hypothetical protein
MTYEEVIGLWKESQEQWQQYKFSVGAVGRFIYLYLLEKLSLTGEKAKRFLKIVPPNEKDDNKLRNTIYAPYACVDLKNDGWAEFGLLLLLEHGENTWPKQQYRFIINIRKTPENWMVKFGKDGSITKLSIEPEKDQLTPIGEEFDKIIRLNTIESLNQWLGIQG